MPAGIRGGGGRKHDVHRARPASTAAAMRATQARANDSSGNGSAEACAAVRRAGRPRLSSSGVISDLRSSGGGSITGLAAAGRRAGVDAALAHDAVPRGGRCGCGRARTRAIARGRVRAPAPRPRRPRRAAARRAPHLGLRLRERRGGDVAPRASGAVEVARRERSLLHEPRVRSWSAVAASSAARALVSRASATAAPVPPHAPEASVRLGHGPRRRRELGLGRAGVRRDEQIARAHRRAFVDAHLGDRRGRLDAGARPASARGPRPSSPPSAPASEPPRGRWRPRSGGARSPPPPPHGEERERDHNGRLRCARARSYLVHGRSLTPRSARVNPGADSPLGQPASLFRSAS